MLQVNASGTAFAAALESLPIDELELGSLRGVLVGAVLDVDLAAQTGRLTANLASPRFSGLAGTSLSTTARCVCVPGGGGGEGLAGGGWSCLLYTSRRG